MITFEKKWHLAAVIWLSALVGYHGGTYLRCLVTPDLTRDEQVAIARTLAACLQTLADHHEGNEEYDGHRETDR